MNFLSFRYLINRPLQWFFIILAAVSISACGKSEEKICIDKQSHLWDSNTNDKNANKAYWKAVKQCKQTHP